MVGVVELVGIVGRILNFLLKTILPSECFVVSLYYN